MVIPVAKSNKHRHAKGRVPSRSKGKILGYGKLGQGSAADILLGELDAHGKVQNLVQLNALPRDKSIALLNTHFRHCITLVALIPESRSPCPGIPNNEEMRPYLIGRVSWHDQTLQMWIEAFLSPHVPNGPPG